MALLMALHMASPTMALAPMASLKGMASSPLPMVNNLQLLILLRVMDKHILSNLLDISLPSSLSILKVLQLDLSRHGSASSSLLETSPLSESSEDFADIKCALQMNHRKWYN